MLRSMSWRQQSSSSYLTWGSPLRAVPAFSPIHTARDHSITGLRPAKDGFLKAPQQPLGKPRTHLSLEPVSTGLEPCDRIQDTLGGDQSLGGGYMRTKGITSS